MSKWYLWIHHFLVQSWSNRSSLDPTFQTKKQRWNWNYLKISGQSHLMPVCIDKYCMELVDFKNNLFWKGCKVSRKFDDICFGRGWRWPNAIDLLRKHSMNFTEMIKCVCYVEFAESGDPERGWLEEYKSPWFAANLYKQFQKGKDTDVTINCGSEQIKAHKFILRSASEVFDEMFQVKEESSPSIFTSRLTVDGVTFKDFLQRLPSIYLYWTSVN